jgi:uncharacterized protein
MNIREYVFHLKNLYADMSATFAGFQTKSGLSCLAGCGRCCLNPEIEASPLEMLPLALELYDQGLLEEWLTKLANNSQSHCLLFVASGQEGQGFCGQYAGRPSVCRMFGVAGYFNKHQEPTLSICKSIKESNSKDLPSALGVPMLAHWSAKLATLDPQLIQGRQPINQALKAALEKVALCAQYQKL